MERTDHPCSQPDQSPLGISDTPGMSRTWQNWSRRVPVFRFCRAISQYRRYISLNVFAERLERLQAGCSLPHQETGRALKSLKRDMRLAHQFKHGLGCELAKVHEGLLAYHHIIYDVSSSYTFS